jgi:hypothetical protein
MGCEWQLRSSEDGTDGKVFVQRYDRMETLYLTTGDVAALHQMNTDYPEQTRTLIEDLLQLGHVNDSGINKRFFLFFQDTTLQTLIEDVNSQYADMSDIDDQLTKSFQWLKEHLPNINVPTIYTQISSLDQSIVVCNGSLGVSLDKYLGINYPVYIRYGFTERQRTTMTRSYIVPDCLCFYLLSLYPLSPARDTIQSARFQHMGRIQHVINSCLGYQHFKNDHVKNAEAFLEEHPGMTFHDMLLDSE